MAVTESGIEYVVEVFPIGYRIIVVLSLLNNTPSIDEYCSLNISTSILSNDLHPENAWSPIDVTELGIKINDNDLQSKNADSPIDLTELGIVIDDNDVQYENA